jgi:hypothetical protein
MLSVLMLSVLMECHESECRRYAECHYAECRYAECRSAECHYAECRYVLHYICWSKKLRNYEENEVLLKRPLAPNWSNSLRLSMATVIKPSRVSVKKFGLHDN